MKILIADDDLYSAQNLKEALERSCFVVDHVLDGESALEMARQEEYDAILLDVCMPKIDGFKVLKTLRLERNQSAIFMVTGRGGEDDRLIGLHGGADDYIVKPYFLRELIARLSIALNRRQQSKLLLHRPTVLVVGPLRLDLLAHRVTFSDKPILLTKKEYTLLQYFMRHPKQALTINAIMQHVWGTDFPRESNVVKVTVKYLRDKITMKNGPQIEAIRGVGYRFSL